jgi:cytoskeleton protein RodZ
MDLGATLRDARERRGMSVEDLARVTKIKIDTLRAIDSNAFERVPPGVFTRGFLRTYAREVGLDPEAVVSQYVEQVEPTPEAPPPAELPHKLSFGRVSSASWSDTHSAGDVAPSVWLNLSLVALVAIVITAATVYLAFLAPRSSTTGAVVVPAGAATAQAQPASAATPGAVGTSGPTLRLELTATGPCWISATVVGQRVLHVLMHSGERRAITVADELVLRVGEPGALTYTINGAAGRPFGRPGQPVTVRVAPGTHQEWLATR